MKIVTNTILKIYRSHSNSNSRSRICFSLSLSRPINIAISILNNELVECEAQKNLNIKDLTGAGDLFAAGYLHGVIHDLSIKECLIKGTELSSKIIQKIGARI